MSEISVPVISVRIRVQGGDDSQHKQIKLGHLYALLSLLVFQQKVQDWNEKAPPQGDELTSYFGELTTDRKTIILNYLETAISLLQNYVVVYDLTKSYDTQEFPNVYALAHEQTSTQLTLLICSQFWNLDQKASGTLSTLSGSIFHEVATRAGLQVKWNVFSAADAKQLAQFDVNETANCAANYMYYLQTLIQIAQELVEVYHCTFVSILCNHPSEASEGEKNDEVFLKKNGSKVWPKGKYVSMSFGATEDVGIGFSTSIVQSDSFELWDVDDLSRNDKLETYKLKPDSRILGNPPLAGTEQLLSQAAEGKTYTFGGKKVGGDDAPQGYRMIFSLDKKRLEIVSPSPAPAPPEDIVHDEL
jgi:hypothetical protein